MEITEIRVKLVDESMEKLQGFCTVTFDNEFVVRDLKIITGPNGPFVAMPSRKLTDKCPSCHQKNHLRAHYCNECGHRLDSNRAGKDERGRAKLHTDIAHPIHARARHRIEQEILKAFQTETERAKQPGYKPTRLGPTTTMTRPFTRDAKGVRRRTRKSEKWTADRPPASPHP